MGFHYKCIGTAKYLLLDGDHMHSYSVAKQLCDSSSVCVGLHDWDAGCPGTQVTACKTWQPSSYVVSSKAEGCTYFKGMIPNTSYKILFLIHTMNIITSTK